MFHLRYLPKYLGMKSSHTLDWLPRLWEAGKAERCSDEARLALIHDGFGWWVHRSSYVALSTLTFISSVHSRNILLKKQWGSHLWETTWLSRSHHEARSFLISHSTLEAWEHMAPAKTCGPWLLVLIFKFLNPQGPGELLCWHSYG